MHAYRSHTRGALRGTDAGNSVRLSGWIHRKRDHGGVLFVDLRDHYGITQIVADSDSPALPALDKLLNYYVSFLSAGRGENVSEGRRRIENSLGMVAEAFEKQLDKMYKNEAMDVKTDIALMETMLRMDGLADKNQTAMGKGGNNV